MTRRSFARLRRDRRGTTIVEFAMVAPVMLTLILGLGDLMYQAYVQAILDGAVQKAGRDLALESNVANATTIDGTVEAAVRRIAANATFTPTRRSYASFALVKPENIYDDDNDGVAEPTDGNGRLDPGECYDDVNGNNSWDADPGRNSQGGAEDVTVYTMTVSYPRLFPFAGLLGLSGNQEVTSKTLLKNQPYKAQTVYTVEKKCLPK